MALRTTTKNQGLATDTRRRTRTNLKKVGATRGKTRRQRTETPVLPSLNLELGTLNAPQAPNTKNSEKDGLEALARKGERPIGHGLTQTDTDKKLRVRTLCALVFS